MAYKTISFRVGFDGIAPSTRQRVGMQKNHNMVELEFEVAPELRVALQDNEASEKVVCRFEIYNAVGEVFRTASEDVLERFDDFIFYYYLQERDTRYGGIVKVVLVLTALDGTDTVMESYSFPALLQVESLPEGVASDGKNRVPYSELELKALAAAKVAQDAADQAVEASAAALEVKQAYDNGELKGEDGADGFSPTVDVEQIEGGHRVTITDKSGENTFDVMDSQGGGTTNYEELSDKPKINGVELSGNKTTKDLGIKIPTKLSELDNDKGYLTEHQDISGKLDASKLPEAINDALEQAKASGEFDGKDGADGADGVDGADGADGISPTVAVSKSGKVTTVSITDKNGTKTATINDGADGAAGSNGKDGTSVTVSKVTESTADGGSNVVTFSDGKTVTIKNGSKGSKGDKGDTGSQGAKGDKGDKGEQGIQGIQGEKGADGKDGQDYIITAADKQELKNEVISQIITQEAGESESLVMSQKAVTDLVAEAIGSGGGGGVPDYWLSELKNKADVIQTAMEKAGKNKSAFLWYTDAHWINGNSKVSPKLLNYLYMNTPMNKVNFGGDIIGDTLLATRDEMKYLYEWRKGIKELPNHHSVFGNHDIFESDSVDYDSDNYRYTFMLAPEETPDIVMGDGNYYYIDNPSEKTRYLYLLYSTGTTEDVSNMLAQGAFIVDALKTTPQGWHIVAISHKWWGYGSDLTPETGGLGLWETDVLSVFDAYNARETRNGSSYFTAQDFTNGVGKVEFCIGGHLHTDYDFTSTGGIPVIITTADTNQERIAGTTLDSGIIGTTTESAVFGIVADYNKTDETKITVVGVGRGTCRVVNKNGSTVFYPESGGSDIPDAPDVPVNLFNKNDPDVLDTGRFNSSNNAVAYTAGQLCTGFIEAKVGDVFTVKTDKTLKINSYTCDAMMYNSSKSAINNLNAAMTAWEVSADELTGVLTIPSTYMDDNFSATAFVRFCIAYTDMNNIVITKS